MHEHAGTGHDERGFGVETARMERGGDGVGERGPLAELALPQLRVGVDDRVATHHRGAAVLEHRVSSGSQGVDDRVERRHGVGAGGDFTDDLSLKFRAQVEEHLALVGEVVEERSLGEPRPLSDPGDRRALEPLFLEELESGDLQALGSVRFPSWHASKRSMARSEATTHRAVNGGTVIASTVLTVVGSPCWRCREGDSAMRVFVTGASGYIASAVIPELLSAGHTVIGLARSDRAAANVRSLGADVRQGDLDDLDGLSTAVREADGVIHLAFKHEEQHAGDLASAVAADLSAIATMGAALKGSDKPFVGTSATGALALAGFQGQLTEHDVIPTGPRIDAENTVIALGQQGVRSSVVRLPPTVHSLGHFGFVSGLIAIARASGVAGYLGDGNNRWPSADARDVGRLYRLALESAPAGSRLHAVAEDGIALRDIATVIGRRLGVPVAPVAAEDAERHFGFLTDFVSFDNPTSSQITRDTLGWAPTRPGLIADLDDEHTFAAAVNTPSNG